MATALTGWKRTAIVLGVVFIIIFATALVLVQYEQSNWASGVSAALVTLDGKAYYSTTMPVAANLTTFTLKGVKFSFAFGIQEELPLVVYTALQNVTSVTVPCPSGVQGGAQLCTEFLPQIQVTFPDGSVEYFNKATVVNTTITYQRPTTYPWFSAHTGPQVAIMLKTNAPTASLTFYVST